MLFYWIIRVITGCSSATIHFKYLGLPVGNNMNRSNNWEDIIQKVQNKLATWKVKLLSIGGRLMLTKVSWNILHVNVQDDQDG